MSDKLKSLAIIQARAGSTRLPGKVLLDLEGKTVVERVIERVAAAKSVDQVMVATTISPKDLVLVKLCAAMGITVFCGSEDDVLDRFYQAAKLLKPVTIIRITADCPLIDPEVIDQAIKAFRRSGADYLSNQLEERLPDGQDVEVFSFKALFQAWREAKLASEREHVTPYLRNNPGKFKIAGVQIKQDYSKKRWTLDNAEDYEFIKTVYNRLFREDNLFGMAKVIGLLEKEPALEKINHHIGRNEGYAKSLREDNILETEGING